MHEVGTVMSREVCTAEIATPLATIVGTMAERAISCMVVRAGARPVGIISERDLVRRVLAAGHTADRLRATDVMTTPVTSLTAETTILDALAVLRDGGFRRLPVVDAAGDLVGIVTQTDLLRALFEYLRSVTVNDILETMMQFGVRCEQQDVALATLTRRYRTLDLRCAELLELLYRSIRDLNGPIADIRTFASDLTETTRAIEVLLSAGEHDDPIVRDTVQRAETTLRRIATENAGWLADLTERVRQADRVIEQIVSFRRSAAA